MILIDATLTRSRWRVWVLWTVVSLILGLLLACGLPLWGRWIGSVALLALTVWQVYTPQARLIQLDQLDRDQWRWQLQGSTTRRRLLPPLQRGRLLALAALPCAISLSFELNTPERGRVHLLIWRDQVSVDTWRRLHVLRRFWSPRPTRLSKGRG
jgi:hypothetical protein